MENEIVKLNGKFTYILFHNETNFYTVAKFTINDENERQITVTGTLADIEIDVLYDIQGYYTEHPRFGMQFCVQTYEKPLPNEREGIIRYLSSVQFPGIGQKTAKNIVEVLGEDCLQKIKEDINVLTFVPGLSQKHISSIQEGIAQEDDGMSQLVSFLNIHGIGVRNLIRLNQAYGKDALRKIQENPYRVIEECDGFGFKTADKIAISLGFTMDDERRLYALLVSIVDDLCMETGDTYCLYEILKQRFMKTIGDIECDFDSILHKTIQNQSLKMEGECIYSISQFHAENGIATSLSTFPIRHFESYDEEELDEKIEDMQKQLGITYDPLQIDAIHAYFENPFFVMTGGPGTGKTTIVHAMVELTHKIYPNANIVCCAPTGRAAKRLAELTGVQASTVHSLLKWDLESNSFGKNDSDPIEADVVIMDEFSMVDSYLFSHFLDAAKLIKKICIIGDEDQLPSVGPGSVLRDLIEAKRFPYVSLQTIFRQKEGSDVIRLADAIRRQNVEIESYRHDVAFFDCHDSQVKNTIISIVQSALHQGYQMDDIQVLSPMYRGPCGIDILNNALQEAFNPPEKDKMEVKNGFMTLREGDKILQLKNQPDDDVYNGDIGILEEIVDAKYTENKKTTLVVNFDGNYIEYIPENWDKITLAYCISVHKSQGSEYPIVIMPFSRQHTIMLQKKLIYTAITRAKKSLILLGDKAVFEHGINTSEYHSRSTNLVSKLHEYM